jgi:hypothetical protein
MGAASVGWDASVEEGAGVEAASSAPLQANRKTKIEVFMGGA